VNRRRAAKLRGVLSVSHPGAEVDVTPEPDGAQVIISGSGNGCGATQPHMGTGAKFLMRDDGSLMRFLLNGHV
jgi:hypothetical protein